MNHPPNNQDPTPGEAAAANLARFLDHTLLKPEATARDIEQLCAEAREHGFFSVCVNGSRVDQARRLLEGAN